MSNGQSNRSSASSYVLCYGLYVVLLVLIFVVVFGILRQAVLNVLLAMNGQSYANRLLYFVSLLLMGLVAFVVAIAGEPYMRGGIRRGLVLRRFARLAVPFVIAGIVGVLLNLWAINVVTGSGERSDPSVHGRSQTIAREAA